MAQSPEPTEKMSSVVACACDPGTGEGETGRSLGLTGWLPWSPWQIPGK